MSWVGLRAEILEMFEEASCDMDAVVGRIISIKREARRATDRHRAVLRTMVVEHETCKICGKSFPITLEHLDRGRHPETCSPRCRGVMRHDARVMCDGEFLTIGEISRRSGVAKNTVGYRARVGIRNLTQQPAERVKRLSVGGELLTLSEISKRYGIPRTTLEYRLSAGAEDVTKPIYNRRRCSG